MLSVLFAAATVLVLANLLIILVLFLLVFRAFHKFIGEETLNTWNLESFVPKTFPFNRKSPEKEQENESPQYTPTGDVPQRNIPLDEFTPNFEKPVEIVYEDEGEDHGMKVVEGKDA
jgi:hypothetical protein